MPEGIGYGKDSREGKRQAFMSAMKAGTKSPAKAVAKAKPRKKVSKLRRRVKELIGGSKTYLPKKKKKAKPVPLPVPKSQRDVLRRNLTKKEIERFK
jgi:hypothetical protein